jgi:hypothetical protein
MDIGAHRFRMGEKMTTLEQPSAFHIDSEKCWCKPYWNEKDYGKFLTHYTYDRIVSDFQEELDKLRGTSD